MILSATNPFGIISWLTHLVYPIVCRHTKVTSGTLSKLELVLLVEDTARATLMQIVAASHRPVWTSLGLFRRKDNLKLKFLPQKEAEKAKELLAVLFWSFWEWIDVREINWVCNSHLGPVLYKKCSISTSSQQFCQHILVTQAVFQEDVSISFSWAQNRDFLLA